MGFLSFFKAFVKGFLTFFKAFLKGALSFFKAFLKGALSFFKAFVKGFLTVFKNLFTGCLSFLRIFERFLSFSKAFSRGSHPFWRPCLAPALKENSAYDPGIAFYILLGTGVCRDVYSRAVSKVGFESLV